MGFGHLGARGVEGGRALAAGLEQRVFDDRAWHDDVRRLRQAVRYLNTRAGGAAAMKAHDVTADPATLTAWLSRTLTPGPDQQQRLERAFRDLRRRNVAPYLTRVLNAGGGSRIEIHPVDQGGVDARHQRELRVRWKNVWRWNTIIKAWAREDSLEMEYLWQDLVSDMDSDHRSYHYVHHIGIRG